MFVDFSSTPSDSDRGPPMRGVDGRGGGGYAGEGGNPPAGGRGRGMVLPAWMTNQQTPPMGGPVSFLGQRHHPTSVAGSIAQLKKKSQIRSEVRSSSRKGAQVCTGFPGL